MSSHAETPAEAPTDASRKPACTLCTQRKVKCDRNSPCANCIKVGQSFIEDTFSALMSHRLGGHSVRPAHKLNDTEEEKAPKHGAAV